MTLPSAISTLSWTGLDGRHWTGLSCWYASIILAIVSVLSGAQQTILLESLQNVDFRQTRIRLCGNSYEPKWTVVFAWQCHLMLLSWAFVCYIAGLTSYIVSPVAINPVWDDNAKVCLRSHHSPRLVALTIYRPFLFYTVTSLGTGLMFVISSRLIHNTFKEPEQAEPWSAL